MYLSDINNTMDDGGLRSRSVLELAFVGDAVWELLVREAVAQRNVPPEEFHRETVRLVNAPAQSESLERMRPALTAEEEDVVRKGRNANRRTPPRGSSAREYRSSTALETLFGYLWLAGRADRIVELFNIAEDGVDPSLSAAGRMTE
ncbi:MAG: Mini-ribonuclease 3 [Oscillospiraceae bacterium]|jgi:ribonuclease-3 family protein